MIGGYFFVALSGLALLAFAMEAGIGWVQGRRWYDLKDALANINLGAGNVIMTMLLAGVIYGGYSAAYTLRLVDLNELLPRPVFLAVGFAATDLCQYGGHRLAHRWNVLWWAHITHHSSTYLNLTTAFRINWLYRGLFWVHYVPLALIGVPFESFMGFQLLMNLYNLFGHTPLPVRMGPLTWVFISPQAHRLHHANLSDPSQYGNYGVVFSWWDRLFGTYRDPADYPEIDQWGIGENVDHADPLQLNFHHLRDLWETSKQTRQSFVGLFCSFRPPTVVVRHRERSGPPSLLYGALGLGVLLVCIAIQQHLSAEVTAPGVLVALVGLALCVVYGRALQHS